jgi:hypothetical protein
VGSSHDGKKQDDAGSVLPQATYTTTCSPNLDVADAGVVMATVVAVPPGCYIGTPPPTPVVIDSSAALTALFSTDAGAECSSLTLPTTVDYTADRVVVLGAASGSGTLSAYQVGSKTVLDISVKDFAAAVPVGVFVVVLPVADTTSIEVTTCTTTCSGACPP